MSDFETAPTHDWNGESGTRWAANLARLDVMLEDFGQAAIDAANARPGEHILDIGCGSGTSTFLLAEQAGPDGHVYPSYSSRSPAQQRLLARQSSFDAPMPLRLGCLRGASTSSSRALA